MEIIHLFIIIVLTAVVIWQFFLRIRAQASVRLVQQALISRDRKIQTILENAPIVFSAIDTRGVFHISEGKGLQKLGRENNQSVGVSIFDMHDRNPVIIDAVERALKGEQVATSFVLNGVSYDLFMGPEKDEHGVVTGVSMLSVDITDRIRAEAEKAQLQVKAQAAIETSKLKSEFVATMSHEIRTPLNGVLGMTTLLLNTDLNPKQKEYADAIHQSGTTLLALINDILDFSKVEAGKLEFEEIPFDLPELVQHSMKSLKLVAEQNHLTLKVSVDPAVTSWVVGDPGRVRQVLSNLVANAIKFTKKGEVRVRVLPDSIQRRSGVVSIRFEVQDTGIGISKENIEKLFTAFSQADASMARRFGGTGLGLSICKQLVTKMGGDIGVESVEGQGSTFWFYLPFQEGAHTAKKPKNSETQKLETVFTSETAPVVLVAEDNEVNQKIIVTMLEIMGCKPDVVTSGTAALEALHQNKYDLVLMDVQMPEMDGLEATRRWRAQPSSKAQQIPILAMTANAMKGDREKCIEAGMDDYVSKPVNYEELSTAITRWIEIQRQRSQA